MSAEPTDENIMLLDDPDLYREITGFLSAPKGTAQGLNVDANPLPSGGTGFALSRRFLINDAVFNFLLLNAANAQPFAYLTLGQRTLNRKVPLVVAIAGALSLDRDLYPGDIALVSEAVALPYPALYKNAPAKEHNRGGVARDSHAEVYQANAELVTKFMTLASEVVLPQTWQKNIAGVRTGYAKHPTWRGGLETWAPEQLDSLKDAGLSTISQMPAGVYEVQNLCPDTRIICFNMIKGRAGEADNNEWERRKNLLLFPAIRLLADIISDYNYPR